MTTRQHPLEALLSGLHPTRTCLEDSPETLSSMAHQIVHFSEDLNALGHVKASYNLKIEAHKLEEAAQAMRLANCMEQALVFAPAGGNKSAASMALMRMVERDEPTRREEVIKRQIEILRQDAKKILGAVRKSVPESN